MEKHTMANNSTILRAAHKAWASAASLRAHRLRNKQFTYGDQWIDMVVNHQGQRMSEWQHYCDGDGSPITNNVLRQLVKTIVGRFRSQYMNGRQEASRAAHDSQEEAGHHLVTARDELDSRALEEFLISGCCIQRVDKWAGLFEAKPRLTNVNLNRFFVNAISDPLARDCELVGQLHDMSVAELLKHVAQGSRRKAAWVRRLYSENAGERMADFAARIGADSHSSTQFWNAEAGKCRAIEVWTLESREVLVCHDRALGKAYVAPLSALRELKSKPNVTHRWDIATMWHCRWFSPMGDLLCDYESPYAHGSHPYVLKFYPLTDGEVHGFIEDVIDQQKFINRLITLIDRIMRASAKGVLLYPDTALPDGLTWGEVRQIWQNCNGILPYSPAMGEAKPEQITVNNTNFGAYEMVQLQLKLLEEISGVSGALQGKNINTSGSASLYQRQADNSNIALTDIFETFNHFRACRDKKMRSM